MKLIRTITSDWICKIGSRLISRGFRLDPNGGAAVIVVVHGSHFWSRSWHIGWANQARKASSLAVEESEALLEHARLLDEIETIVATEE